MLEFHQAFKNSRKLLFKNILHQSGIEALFQNFYRPAGSADAARLPSFSGDFLPLALPTPANPNAVCERSRVPAPLTDGRY
jgi:hypothetical protein